MTTQFICNQCKPIRILNETQIREHISTEHLNHFPFRCVTCRAANQMYLSATEDDMDLHISANHGEHNSGILQLEDPAKEVELNKMIEQCRRWPLQQGPSNDSKRELRRRSDLLDGPGTSTGIGNAAQNGPGFTRVKEEIGSDDDVMIIEDSNETSAMLNNSSHGDSPEQPTQEPDERIASVNPISNSEDLLLFPNAVMTKSEPLLSQENDNFERPTTSSQIASSVSADSSCKHTISKLLIVISEGIVYFETIDRRTFEHPLYPYAPLSDYLATLLESKLSYGCNVAIQFYASDEAIPYEYRKLSDKPVKEFTSLGQLKTFATHIRSIAYLWSHFPISAYFGQYKQKSNNTLSQSDYCTELFSGEQSILKCKELDVTFFDFWPLSIVTNVVDKCRRCELNSDEAFPRNRHLYDEFLDEMYGGDMLQRIRDISLRIPIEANANDFIEKLKQRFLDAPHKRFKFGLYSPSMEIHKLYLQSHYHILQGKVVIKEKKLFSNCVTIEQRSFYS